MLASQYTQKGREPSSTASQVGEDQDQWSSDLRQHVTHIGFHARRERKIDALLEEGRNWSNPFGHIWLKLSVVRKATQQRAQLLQVTGHGHESQSRYFLGVWAHARGRDGVAQEIGVRRAESGFQGREIEVVLAQSLEEGTDGFDVGRRV